MQFELLKPIADFFVDKNLNLIAPELILTVFFLASVCGVTFAKTDKERFNVWNYAFLGCLLTLICLLLFWQTDYFNQASEESLLVFNNMFKADSLSVLTRILLAGGSLLVLLFSRVFIERALKETAGEFYVVFLSALLGAMFLSGANDLIMMFVSLETLSISSYVMVGMIRGNLASNEAGFKYLLYGGVSTAVLLFGLSILYGLTGSTQYVGVFTGFIENASQLSPIVLSMMSVMLLAGIAFKLSAAPFHLWAPDAYEGGATPVIAFLSVVSKIAAFVLAVRLFSMIFIGLQGWVPLLSALSVLSMVIGNVVALTQKNIKRLLAYSTVAHVGYLLLSFVVMSETALGSLLYYLITYLFMNLGAFAVVTYFENTTGSNSIADYAGLIRKKPLITLTFSVMLLSLAGIPITAGFFGKFFIFQAVATSGNQYLWLIVIALLTSTISLFYYLNVIRLMVIEAPSSKVSALPDKDAWLSSVPPFATNTVLILCFLMTVLMGIFAEPTLKVCKAVINQSVLTHTAIVASAADGNAVQSDIKVDIHQKP
ncbi:MAG: NADH-quinone oxidoreductase subunit N [Cyanobacteria bacterium P01_H01_bin.74]